MMLYPLPLRYLLRRRAESRLDRVLAEEFMTLHHIGGEDAICCDAFKTVKDVGSKRWDQSVRYGRSLRAILT